MPGPLTLIARASPWLLKQVPKLWPLLLESKNRERLEQAVQDLASKSPRRRLQAQIELTAGLAERVVDKARTDDERTQAQEWERRAQNLLLRLDMPVADRKARRTQRQAVQAQLAALQGEMDQYLDR